MQHGALGSNASFGQKDRSKAVIRRGLAMQMIAVFQRDLRIVRDDFILARPLEKQHVAQGDTGEIFQVGSGLDGVIDFVLLLVDEDVNRMLLHHKMLLCRSRRPLDFAALCARNTNLRLSSPEISYAVVSTAREQNEQRSNGRPALMKSFCINSIGYFSTTAEIRVGRSDR